MSAHREVASGDSDRPSVFQRIEAKSKNHLRDVHLWKGVGANALK
jgi:hypothetical protein